MSFSSRHPVFPQEEFYRSRGEHRLQAKSIRESYSVIAGNNIAAPNPGSEGASSVFPPQKVFADQKENQHLFLFSGIAQEALKEFFRYSRKINTAKEQGGAPQEKWRSHIQETGGAGIAQSRGSVEL